MAKYRTALTAYWNDPYTESLPMEGKLLYMYLFTSPHVNNLGVLEVSHGRISYETGVAVKTVKRLLEQMQDDGKVTLDQNYILLNNFIKNQTSTSPKILLGLKCTVKEIKSKIILSVLSAKYPELEINTDTLCIPYIYPMHCIPYPNLANLAGKK